MAKVVEIQGKTVFVRNIPVSTTEESFTSLLSDIGPVKRCFIVKEKGSAKSRGFGYVTFSLKEDAASALSQTLRLDGQRLILSAADRKCKKSSKPAKNTPSQETPGKPVEAAASKDEKSPQAEPAGGKPQAAGKGTAQKTRSGGKGATENPPAGGKGTAEKPQAAGKGATENPPAGGKGTAEKPPAGGKGAAGRQQTGTAGTHQAAAATLVLTGFSSDVTHAKLETFFMSVRDITDWKLMVTGDKEKTAHLKFASRQVAVKASRVLGGDVLKQFGQIEVCRLSQQIIRKKAASNKQARLIIRNLSFKCTEKHLKEMFAKFGFVTDVKIPTKKDGKMFGFGFVQLESITAANRALTEMNSTQIHGRPVAVDWAVAKDKYERGVLLEKEASVKDNIAVTDDKKDMAAAADDDDDSTDEGEDEEEAMETDCKDVKIEKDAKIEKNVKIQKGVKIQKNVKIQKGMKIQKDVKIQKNVKIEREEEDMEIVEDSSGSEDDEDDEDGEDSDDEQDGEEDSDEEDSEADDETDDETDDDDDEKPAAPSKGRSANTTANRASDVDFGRTLFLRNVPFKCDGSELSALFEQFGDVNYCTVVKDKQTDQPKGMAFVQFKTKSAAEECLAATTDSSAAGLVLDGRRLVVTLALSRERAQQLQKEGKVVEKKDKRNLGLAREGLIRAGTQSADALSTQDLAKRERIDAAKRQRLRRPDIFVSETRLCVHNLPVSVDDQQLRRVFLKAAADRKCVITECRVMRDLDNVNSQGVAKSRGYAFVNFTEHAHALAALRGTNNNADVFGENRKPIVEFSLENKTALLAKEKRVERMMAKQEELKAKSGGGAVPSKGRKRASTGRPTGQPAGRPTGRPAVAPAGRKQPSGGKSVAAPLPKGMPSHRGPKIRHKKRVPPAAQPTQRTAAKRKPTNITMRQKQKKPPKKREKADDTERLVNKYRKLANTKPQREKNSSRWFEST